MIREGSHVCIKSIFKNIDWFLSRLHLNKEQVNSQTDFVILLGKQKSTWHNKIKWPISPNYIIYR